MAIARATDRPRSSRPVHSIANCDAHRPNVVPALKKFFPWLKIQIPRQITKKHRHRPQNHQKIHRHRPRNHKQIHRHRLQNHKENKDLLRQILKIYLKF